MYSYVQMRERTLVPWHTQKAAPTPITCVTTLVEAFDLSVSPGFLAAPDPIGNLRLESRRAKREPFLSDLINQATFVGGVEPEQPIQCLLLRALSRRDGHVDRQAIPHEIRRQRSEERRVGKE